MAKVLIVDDDPTFLLMAKAFAEKLDCEVEAFENSKQALQYAKDENDIAVAVFDVEMPGMGGFELAKKIKDIERHSELPVIFMTGSKVDEKSITHGYKMGAVDYVIKPLNALMFKSKLACFLNLHAKQKKLENLVEQNRRFVGIVSHDLRSPLTDVQGVIEFLIDFPEGREDTEMLKSLKTRVNGMVELIHDLLDVTAIETGKIVVNPEKMDLGDVFDEGVSLVQLQAKEKNVDLVVTKIDTPVNGDPKRLVQVVQNLLSNAIKFSKENDSIELKAQLQEEGIYVHVKDGGMGIPEDKIPKLFDKHEQTTTLGTNNEKGTGFGLPLVNEIIEAHGAQIKVESAPGKGSCFSFILPVGKD